MSAETQGDRPLEWQRLTGTDPLSGLGSRGQTPFGVDSALYTVDRRIGVASGGAGKGAMGESLRQARAAFWFDDMGAL